MIQGKIVFEAEIKNISPLIIGCGKDELSDIDIILDGTGKPFIPATSFCGVIKNVLKNSEFDKKEFEIFWGYSKDNSGHQSNFICDDLFLKDNQYHVNIRDGIAIDGKRGIVEDQSKYDYQILERGHTFVLYCESSYSENIKIANSKEFVLKIFSTIKNILESKNLHIGAKTNSGFGLLELVSSNVYDYDFSKPELFKKWLKREKPNALSLPEPHKIKTNRFCIKVTLSIKDSMILRSYSNNPNDPDSVQMKSRNQFVITGTGIKGALRHRANKILNVIFDNNETLVKKVLNQLFGNVDKEKKQAKKGRLKIEESYIDFSKVCSEIQTRIKIDRFTGGTIKGALLETMPMFALSNGSSLLDLEFEIDQYKEYEAGLLLLLLKDLWTGDLPIGGEKSIGRGVLLGKKANISWDTNQVSFSDPKDLTNDEKGLLEKFVKALNEYKGDPNE